MYTLEEHNEFYILFGSSGPLFNEAKLKKKIPFSLEKWTQMEMEIFFFLWKISISICKHFSSENGKVGKSRASLNNGLNLILEF